MLRLPESPRKIRACGKLYRRNPSSAPMRATVGMSTEKFPRSAAAAMIVAHATTAMPPASPFKPSMKLKTLVTPTIHSITRGTPNQPSETPTP